MRPIANDSVKLTLAIVFGVVLAASLFKPPYPEFLWLQHIPTAIAVMAIPMWDRRCPLGRGTFACVLGMLVLHVIGARYIYSLVPYDTWTEVSVGMRLSDVFDLERNHYDRLVHLCFGLLLIWPIREFLETYKNYSRRGAIVIAVMATMTTSLLYEVVEWMVAIVLSPEDAQAYNGQQGDFWDAQKDMALACTGAILAGAAQWKGSAKGPGTSTRLMQAHTTDSDS